MKATRTQKIRIGLFTLLGFALFVAGIFIIGSKKNMFGNSFPIYGMFRNVGGLQVGNNVRFLGINVGTVEGITIANDTTVRVDMRIESRVKPFLKKDAVASIGSDGLMGDKLVVIAPGENGEFVLGRGGQIRTNTPVDFDKLVAKVARVVDNADTITSSLANITGEISHGKGSIGKLIYSDTLERGLERTVNAAHATIETVKSTAQSAKTTVESAKKGVEGFDQNMTALQHNFLLRGYFKNQKKEEKKKERREERLERREERRQNNINEDKPHDPR